MHNGKGYAAMQEKMGNAPAVIGFENNGQVGQVEAMDFGSVLGKPSAGPVTGVANHGHMHIEHLHLGREDKEVDPHLVQALQNTLAEKESEIASFLEEQGVSSRKELQAALDTDKASLPDAKGIKLKNLQSSIATYTEALATFDQLVSEHRTLKKQIAALTPAGNAEGSYDHAALGENSKAVHIEGDAKDITLSDAPAASGASYEKPLLAPQVKAHHAAIGRNSKVVHVEGNAGNLSL